ncbi:MAG: LTA synthase family protein [Turicibacter sp.]
MKNKIKKHFYNYTTLCVLASIILNFLIEAFSRHSLLKGFEFLIGSPLIFLYNSLIILFTFSILLLVKRKVFTFTFISTIWLAGGITNGIVLDHRVTPFTANELKLMDSLFSILEKYFSKFEIGLLLAAIGLAIIGVIAAFVFSPKQKTKINYKKNISLFAGSILAFTLITNVAIKSELVSTYFGNIAFAYLDYGFPYCFSNSLLNTGIKRPINYSEESIKNIYSDIEQTSEVDPFDHLPHYVDNENNLNQAQTKKPNIVMVQLESFFDPTYVKDLEFSEDPIPNFRALKENYSSGFLSVPSIGAGTANTEFEVIAGMSLDFFGPGEYPYKTILKETTVESVNYNLSEQGYATHAIHNNKGTFYTRQNVFKKLGFDTFTSIEYMNVDEFTPNDWAKDKFLTESITDALFSTENEDFVYTISVQGHGDYPEEPVEGHSKITLSGFEDQGRLNAFEYYVNEIKEMDDFIAELVQALEAINEPTVLVLFGDHLPTLDLTDEEISNGDLFQTEYVIWSNMNLRQENVDLEAYQLTAQVLDQIGIHSGIINNYHQNFKESTDYMKNLQLLQYDMLYGKQFVYGGVNPYAPTKLQMGVKQILISDVYQEDTNLIVKGQHFTPSSRITINGNAQTTQYIDRETLLIENYTFNEADTFKVQQVTVTNHVLGSSEKFILGGDDELEITGPSEDIINTDTPENNPDNTEEPEMIEESAEDNTIL